MAYQQEALEIKSRKAVSPLPAMLFIKTVIFLFHFFVFSILRLLMKERVDSLKIKGNAPEGQFSFIFSLP